MLVAPVLELQSVVARGYTANGDSYLKSEEVGRIASLLVDHHDCRFPIKLGNSKWLNLCYLLWYYKESIPCEGWRGNKKVQ